MVVQKHINRSYFDSVYAAFALFLNKIFALRTIKHILFFF